MDTASIFVVVLLFIAVVTVAAGVKTVPQASEWTVERFGRYIRTLSPGLNFIIPFVDRIGAKIRMFESLLEIQPQQAITKDNALVTVDGVVFFQVIDASRAAYEVANLQAAIANLTLTNIRTVIGAMDLDEALSKRDDINRRLLATIDEATGPWGLKVTRVEIKEITPPESMITSMARQMQAERDRRAAILEAEGFKQAAILKAEGEKQAAILSADARLEAAKRDAEAREVAAHAEAEATRMVSEAISKGNMQAVNYFVAQKYIDALGRMASANNQKLVVVPMDHSGIMGTVASVAELVKDTLTSKTGGAMPQGSVPRGRA